MQNNIQIYYKKLEAFVYNHPLGNIYQSPDFYNNYLYTKNYEPILIFESKNHEIIGSVLGIIIKQSQGLIGKLSARSLIIGGPLAIDNNEVIIKKLLNGYEKSLNKKAIYTEVREIYDLPFKNILQENGYNIEKRLNIIIDLTKSEDLLWNEVYSKRKNEIRKAAKKGIVVKEFFDIDNLTSSYNILKEVYKRVRLPIADFSLFLNIYNNLLSKKMIRLFGAFYGSELIGTMYVLCYKDRAIDWYAGSKQEHYDKNPNDIIPWEAIRILKNDGYKVFDFGGAGKPGVIYGVRDYKKKFGGDFIEINRYQKIHKPLLMSIGKIGLNIWQKFK